jgi:hypothetical protein
MITKLIRYARLAALTVATYIAMEDCPDGHAERR